MRYGGRWCHHICTCDRIALSARRLQMGSLRSLDPVQRMRDMCEIYRATVNRNNIYRHKCMTTCIKCRIEVEVSRSIVASIKTPTVNCFGFVCFLGFLFHFVSGCGLTEIVPTDSKRPRNSCQFPQQDWCQRQLPTYTQLQRSLWSSGLIGWVGRVGPPCSMVRVGWGGFLHVAEDG